MVILLVSMGSSGGGLLYQYVTGALFELYGVKVFMYIYLQAMLCILVLYGVMTLIARSKGSRFEPNQTNDSVKKDTDYELVAGDSDLRTDDEKSMKC